MQDSYLRRTWAEIDLDALEQNFRQIRGRVGAQAALAAVVKADAYGHGARVVAPALERMGADWFAVSNIEEAIELRSAGIERPILILGYTPPECAAALSKYRITQALLSKAYAERLSAAATAAGVSVSAHLKVDTGMSRVGLFFQSPARDVAAVEAAAAICALPGLAVDGIFTHFAVSDAGADGEAFTRGQYEAFVDLIRRLDRRGISFRWRHCDNSGAVMCYPDTNLDLVRPGIILYGLLPDRGLNGLLPLAPVMSLRSVVSLVKTVPAESTVSYGRTFSAAGALRIATVPVGYADGYSRRLSSRGSVLVRGRRAPIVGRICMDQLMVDVTGIPGVTEGDRVTLVGGDGGERISFEELAELTGTIDYELVCAVSRRVPRVYYQNGRKIAVEDHLLNCQPDMS